MELTYIWPLKRNNSLITTFSIGNMAYRCLVPQDRNDFKGCREAAMGKMGVIVQLVFICYNEFIQDIGSGIMGKVIIEFADSIGI